MKKKRTHPSQYEVEIKLRLPARLAKIRRTLRQAGFRIAKRRSLETNAVFDDAKRSLRKRGKLIRIRTVGRLSLLTFKGPSEPGRHKKRREIETDLIDPGSFEEILKQIGYQPAFRYEKFRTEYSKRAVAGIVMLDETPIGNFLEIEGNPNWIDRTARLLGFSSADYITQSYGSLYLKYCRERGVRPRDMLFRHARRSAVYKYDLM